MARPRKGEELHARATIAVRLKPDLRRRVEKLARQHRRSLTDEVRAILEAAAPATASPESQ
jgi:predicted transcriptional regulator